MACLHKYDKNIQGKLQEEDKVTVMENLKFVEEQLKWKKFFGGEKIGFLDILFGWLNLASVIEEVAGVKLIDGDNFPLLKAWMELFSDVPVIKESWPDQEKLIIKYQLRREKILASAAAKWAICAGTQH